MKVNKKLRAEANAITRKYSKWIEPRESQNMYSELNEIGITTGLIYNNWHSCEWYYNREKIENSLFVLQKYSDYSVSETKNEYNIYFS